MAPVFFDDDSLRMMQRHLDLATQRQSLISANIANVDTPGYKTVDLNFEKELEAAIQGEAASLEITHPNHLPATTPSQGPGTPALVENLSMRNDLNNVSVDREMVLMAQNRLLFDFVAERIAGRIRTMKTVIASDGT
jgi:flagellar basal-body rod protein FlgB